VPVEYLEKGPARPAGAWWRAFSAGLLLLLLAAVQSNWMDWAAIGIMGALALATGLFAFRVGHRSYVSFSAAVYIATIALFGIPAALWVTALSTALIEFACFRHRPRRALAEMGTQIVSVFGAGAAYICLGGFRLHGGLSFADAGRFLAMFAVAGAVSVVVRDMSGIAERRSLADYGRWLAGHGVIVELAMLPFALLLAAAYIPGEPATFPLLAVVLMVSSAAGKALWDAQQSLRRRLTELGTLHSIANALSQTLRLDQLVQLLEKEVRPLFDTSIVALCLIDSEEAQIEYRACFANGGSLPAWRGKPGSTPEAWIIDKREALLIDDLENDKDARILNENLTRTAQRRGILARTYLGVPLLTSDDLVGVLTVICPEPSALGQSDVDLFVTLGSQVTQAVTNATLYEGLDEARSQVESWGKTLEQKVEERTAELVDARAELEDLNRDLERRVEERTLELGEMQSVIAQSARLAAVGELAGGVAHELNNPLGGILGYVQYDLERISKSGGNGLPADEVDKITKHLKSIEEASRRCSSIVQSLLTFSQDSKNTHAPLDVNAIVREALRVSERQFNTHGIRVDERLDDSMATVSGDAYQLRQVFSNLITNAREAMPEGGRLTVETTSFVAASGEPVVDVVVKDTGCGIPPNEIGRIFEPFFSTKTAGSGTGLGLSVSYGIVQDHGGEILVDSTEGTGTVFTVRLPLAAPDTPGDKVGSQVARGIAGIRGNK
jgi:signal transduction histidine kinase